MESLSHNFLWSYNIHSETESDESMLLLLLLLRSRGPTK